MKLNLATLSEILNYLNPKILARLENILLKAKLSAEVPFAGHHHSRSKGTSIDFAEHRQYVPGDEIKYLDWKVYGKSDRFYIKEFQQETNLKIYILLDASKSMEYASTSITKFQYAYYLASAIAYLGLKHQDSVGLVIFSESIKKYIPPSSSFEHLKIIMKEIEELNPDGRTNIAYAVNEFGHFIKKRSLIILISDFFDDEEEIIKTLKLLRARRCSVIVLHTLDPVEIELTLDGNFNFHCVESFKNIEVDTKAIREEYKKLINKFIDKLRANCNQNGIDYLLINTDINELIIQ